MTWEEGGPGGRDPPGCEHALDVPRYRLSLVALARQQSPTAFFFRSCSSATVDRWPAPRRRCQRNLDTPIRPNPEGDCAATCEVPSGDDEDHRPNALPCCADSARNSSISGTGGRVCILMSCCRPLPSHVPLGAFPGRSGRAASRAPLSMGFVGCFGLFRIAEEIAGGSGGLRRDVPAHRRRWGHAALRAPAPRCTSIDGFGTNRQGSSGSARGPSGGRRRRCAGWRLP